MCCSRFILQGLQIAQLRYCFAYTQSSSKHTHKKSDFDNNSKKIA